MGPELDTQSLATYGIGVEISVTILVFILDYFQEKIMTDFFKKKKKLFWGHFGLFCPNLDKNKFSWKKGLSQFLNIPIIYHCAKNQKKTDVLFLRKMLNQQMEEWTDNCDFAGPFVGQWSNYKVTFKFS